MENATRAGEPDAPIHAVVVLSDVRASRQLEDRAAFGDRMDAVLADVNAEPERLVGRFVRQAGLDEFAGVVRPGRAGFVLRRMWHGLHPVPVRYAVVGGRLDVLPHATDEELPPASGFDGPAFHLGAQLLEELRSGPGLVSVRTGGADREDRLLTHLGDLVYGQMLDWTSRQMEVVRAFEAADSQQEAADALGVAQSTVSRALSAIGYGRLHSALEAFCDTLDEASREEGSA